MATEQWQHIGSEETLKTKPCNRLHAEDDKRYDLVLVYVRGQFYAMEAWCSHAGGPLFKGDIEDFNGRPHIQCPWHGYLFDAETGKNQLGIKQEMFPTKVENGQVYVQYRCALCTSPFPKS
ncbi:hypothetical protein LSH36_13g06023 [Paralvinella palmiformis]|uniref:Rieske domain-containing protein n=1 Tax=Paralvinella palmiformis TaxID=53620 RepID=A0AAD9KD08_9ANNE|nr:hypothetical protein LSH36_13g06023 [Paralvinella palmiformis]